MGPREVRSFGRRLPCKRLSFQRDKDEGEGGTGHRAVAGCGFVPYIPRPFVPTVGVEEATAAVEARAP